ncbi:MAG: dTDP-4-dehydrorhamnose reductase [Deltaproteobacteria bacterium]|nr:MAG: dTDP-4-dehydrorhamnose reductase [Deltaproteobacteria bacterium]
MKRRVLLLGAEGMLAHDILQVFSEKWEVIPRSRREVDVTMETDVQRAVSSLKPHVVINASGYTKVDAAETERDLALLVNGEAPGTLARICRDMGILLVHYSTDYVFDGKKSSPYREEDPTNPINYYGETKLAGEERIRESGCEHIIIRTQWLFGPRGRNFVFAIVDRLRREGSARVVDDQVGCPTYTLDLARATEKLIDSGGRGTFHFSGEGEATWFDFARRIAEKSIPDEVTIEPIKSRELNLPAERPSYSVLSKEKFTSRTGESPRHWEEMLSDFLKRVFEGGVAW